MRYNYIYLIMLIFTISMSIMSVIFLMSQSIIMFFHGVFIPILYIYFLRNFVRYYGLFPNWNKPIVNIGDYA